MAVALRDNLMQRRIAARLLSGETRKFAAIFSTGWSAADVCRSHSQTWWELPRAQA